MQRVLQNSSAVVTEPCMDGLGNTPQSIPADATVDISRDDGTILAAGAAATPGSTLGDFQVTINNAMTTRLDRLKLGWFNASVGTWTTYVEIVGGFFFSVAELRSQSTVFSNTTEYPPKKLTDMRTTVEQAIERECGVAFVPRYDSGVLTSDNTIARVGLRSIGSATNQIRNEEALVGYEHGMDQPPEPIKQAALLLAKTWLIKGPIDDRVTALSSPESGITATLATPGVRGSVFGIPAVDAAVGQYDYRSGVTSIPMVTRAYA